MSLPIQVMKTGPLPAPSKYKSELPRITGTYPGWWKQGFRLRLWSLVWFQVRATSCHLTSSKSAWKSTPKYTWMCWRALIPRCNQVAGGRPWVWQQDSGPAHKSKETQAWIQKDSNDFVLFSHWSPSASDLNLLDYFVWSYVKNITNMTSHKTKTSLIADIRRVFAAISPWKRLAPSSGSVSKRWLRLKAATLSRCQLYYILKLPEKKAVVLFYSGWQFYRSTLYRHLKLS